MNRKLTLMATALALLAAAARADEVARKRPRHFQKKPARRRHRASRAQNDLFRRRDAPPTPRETKQDVTGTVIDPSGLTVLALSSADPAELYRRMSDEYKIETEDRRRKNFA